MEQKAVRDIKLDIMRAFLLFSVVSAHSSIKYGETSGVFSKWIWVFWQVWSTVGVPGFLIISGYLYKGRTERVSVLFKKKFPSIVLPWIICGVLEYFVSQFRDYSLSGAISYLLGYNSYLYYMTILVLCFVFFYYFVDSIFFLLACIIINLLSLYLTQIDIYNGYFTNFLNVFNWIGYFAVGCLLRKNDLLKSIKNVNKMNLILISMLPITSILVASILGVRTYFYFISFFVGVASFVGLYALSCLIPPKSCNAFSNIGLWSFSIYLLHMSVVAVLKKIVRLTVPNLYVLIPAIVICIFYSVFSLMKKFEKKYPWIKNIERIIGMR